MLHYSTTKLTDGREVEVVEYIDKEKNMDYSLSAEKGNLTIEAIIRFVNEHICKLL